MARCTAELDGVRCKKDEHSEDENHWGLKPDGRDVVWATTVLRPPKEN